MATVRAEARDAGCAGTRPRRPRRAGASWVACSAAGDRARRVRALLVVGAARRLPAHEPDESSSVIAADRRQRPRRRWPARSSATATRRSSVSLPPLARDDVYQVWVQRDGAIEPSSLFVPRRDGTAEAAIPGSLDGADAVLVTREPAAAAEADHAAAPRGAELALSQTRPRRGRPVDSAAMADLLPPPDRETNVACSNCGRPICPDCMTSTPVGMRCPECARRADPGAPDSAAACGRGGRRRPTR